MTLREYLEKTNKTLRVFSSECGIDQSQICRYTTGDRLPSLENARKIEIATNGEVTLKDWTSSDERLL